MVFTYDRVVDPVAVELAVDGHRPVLTPAERVEAVRLLNRRGLSDPRIADHLGCAPETVLRVRRRGGIPACR